MVNNMEELDEMFIKTKQLATDIKNFISEYQTGKREIVTLYDYVSDNEQWKDGVLALGGYIAWLDNDASKYEWEKIAMFMCEGNEIEDLAGKYANRFEQIKREHRDFESLLNKMDFENVMKEYFGENISKDFLVELDYFIRTMVWADQDLADSEKDFLDNNWKLFFKKFS